MKFSVKNLGPIKEGTIAFDKPLTVLVGPNSSGKSYVAYLLYGILREESPFEDMVGIHNIQELDIEKYITKNERGYWAVDMSMVVKDYSNTVIDYVEKLVKKNIAQYFASNQVHPVVDLLSFKENWQAFFDKEKWFYRNIGISMNVWLEDGYLEYREQLMAENSVQYVQEPSANYKLEYGQEVEEALFSHALIILANTIYHSIRNFAPFHYNAFFPAERLALSMLSGTVVENKSREFDTIRNHLSHENVDEQKLLEFIRNRDNKAPKYPLAINDHIYFINGLEHTRKNESPYASFAKEIETMLLKGVVVVDDFGAINFKPQESEQAIGIHVSSSLVKSLAALVLYFKHQAKEGDTLIIDEPEVNLHPDNQRIVARILAKAVHLGFKIVISTHSDYIIRELNNLIALHKIYQEEELKQLVLDNLKDQNYDQVVPLDRENIRVFYFNDNTIQEQEIHEDGFDVSTIDNEIDKLSYASEYIGGVLNAVKKS